MGGPDGAKKGLGVLEWTGAVVPQGLLVKTAKYGWRTAWKTLMTELAPQSKDGTYQRPQYSFQGRIGSPELPLEPGRQAGYHLFVGNPCPWCHRVLLALAVCGLEDIVSFSRAVDDPERASRGGWVFDGRDPVFGCRDLREVYDLLSPRFAGRCTAPLLVDLLSPRFAGRCTAPLLVDKKAKKAVCNESAIITRNFAELAAQGSVGSGVDLYPPELRADIDRWNDRIYESVNNGVYKCGFATSQAGFQRAEAELFAALDELEAVLSRQRFVCGERFTEADLRLFPTIARYDSVYATLFKCSRRRVADYPHLQAWMRDVHQLEVPGSRLQIRDCFDLEDARRSYYSQLFPLNPGGIVPSGPTAGDLGFDAPPGRGPQQPAAVFHTAAAAGGSSGGRPTGGAWSLLTSAIKALANYNGKKNNKPAARCLDGEGAVSSNHRCCAERRLLDTWVLAARRHGVPSHKVVPWVRRKLGPAVVVLRFRGDGSLGCSVPCVLCQRELNRFDLQVHCFLGAGPGCGSGGSGASRSAAAASSTACAGGEGGWFSGRLSDAGAPTPVLTAGQRRTLNLDPGNGRPKKGAACCSSRPASHPACQHSSLPGRHAKAPAGCKQVTSPH
ncbi:hypothetical protein ABPG75_012562 [Micractinium tetrahymenae]